MCRWITLLSTTEVALADVVLTPANSLIQLSKDASFHPGFSQTNNHAMNGDGFGIGWYHRSHVICPHISTLGPFTCPPVEGQTQTSKEDECGIPHRLAAVFKETQPAWNNLNLRELCVATRSSCIIAHVRAASANTGVSRENCHPFKGGRLLFCHNGRIDTFLKMRRSMMTRLSDEAYAHVRGTTDSECIFALILTYLGEDSKGSPITQTTPFGNKRLVTAIKKALHTIEILLEEHELNGPDNFTTLNFALTDGDTIVTTRFCDKSPNNPPPSLYFAFGNAQRLYQELTSEDPAGYLREMSGIADDTTEETTPSEESSGDETGSVTYVEHFIPLERRESRPGRLFADLSVEDLTESCLIVASNPLTHTHTWHNMPQNSILWCDVGCLPELRLLRGRSQSKRA